MKKLLCEHCNKNFHISELWEITAFVMCNRCFKKYQTKLKSVSLIVCTVFFGLAILGLCLLSSRASAASVPSAPLFHYHDTVTFTDEFYGKCEGIITTKLDDLVVEYIIEAKCTTAEQKLLLVVKPDSLTLVRKS